MPEIEKKNDVLATLWARKRIEELTREDYRNQKTEIRQQITQIGLEFNLLTAFTSFVAVEEKIVNENGQPKRVEVPIEMPEGVNRERIGGLSTIPIVGNLFKSKALHGFITQAFISRRDDRANQLVNPPANVTNLTLTIDGASSSENAVVIDAQKPVDRKFSPTVLSEILKRMEAHQKALTSLKADVRMEKFNSALSETDITLGSIKYLPLKNNSTMRIDWTKPVQEVLSIMNDEYVLYRPRLNQAIEGKVKNSEISLNLLKMSKENLRKDFSIKYFGPAKVGADVATVHLKLTPKTKGAFKAIEIRVDANGIIIQAKML